MEMAHQGIMGVAHIIPYSEQQERWKLATILHTACY